MVEGSTENATVVKALLTDLRERGLEVCRPILVVIDGAKALAKAVREIFDRPVEPAGGSAEGAPASRVRG